MDWEDAEMWLEGALQSGWSVAQMRRQRWETLGAIAGEEPNEQQIASVELDEDFGPEKELAEAELNKGIDTARSESLAQGKEAAGKSAADSANSTAKQSPKSTEDSGAAVFAESDRDAAAFVRPFEHLSELPPDLSEAFESYKLAILHHKLDGWQDVSCEDVLASLDALKALATAPSS
jgi:hypothetical protein